MNAGRQASCSAPSSLHGGRKSSKSRGWHSSGPCAAGPWAVTQCIPEGRAGEERQVIQVRSLSTSEAFANPSALTTPPPQGLHWNLLNYKCLDCLTTQMPQCCPSQEHEHRARGWDGPG